MTLTRSGDNPGQALGHITTPPWRPILRWWVNLALIAGATAIVIALYGLTLPTLIDGFTAYG